MLFEVLQVTEGPLKWTYVLTTFAVAVIPLLLAGIGGHLATLALPGNDRSRRRWKLGIWILAIVGILVFAFTQVLAYQADREREAFQTSVLDQLKIIANEPNKAKRQEAVDKLASSFPGAVNPKTSARTQSKASLPNTPAQNVQPTTQPTPAPTTATGTKPDLPIACPPEGTLAYGWVATPTGPNEGINFTYLPKPLNPTLDIERWVKLPANQQQQAQDLYAELLTHLEKPKSLDTSAGAIATENVIKSISVLFSNDGFLSVGYEVHTHSGTSVTAKSSDIPVSSLSKSGRLAIADFRSFTNSAADNACNEALHKLTETPK
ncbi:hypothetical protein [Granulicella sp. S190]|uniref:hypothetical protein n=1 Tax=Granulicella sp. S190 TaxID=1747226 RepID=UPI00131B87BA|nr:hypothetical protein [Granulicella sp. S190]